MDRLIFQGLNQREKEITRAVAEGLSDQEIATRLGLSWGRIRNVLSDVYDQVPACAQGNPRVRLANWYRTVKELGYDDERTGGADRPADPPSLDAVLLR